MSEIGAYNAMFPYYVEVCALTQYRRKGANPGGWGGHATLFINGAELESGAAYPRLRLAADGSGLAHPDSGVGISVNQIFTNVNWVGIPGRDEFFHGGLAPDQSLDEAFYEASVRRAAAANWFAGIEIRPALMRQRPAAVSHEEWIAGHLIATDFALTYARTAYTARLPLTRAAIGKVIGYLNTVNANARERGYTWNPYTNNCSHVLHNALATTGVWDPKQVRGPGAINVARDMASVAKVFALGRMSDFSFPANTFVRAYEAGNRRPIDDVHAAFRDHDVRRTLNEGWLSTGPGALVATYPMHPEARNRLFLAGRDPFLASLPFAWDKKTEFARLTQTPPPELTELGRNLERYRDRYAAILGAERPPDGSPSFRAFAERFFGYIRRALDETNTRIAAYRAGS